MEVANTNSPAITHLLKEATAQAVHQLYGSEVSVDDVICNATRKEFPGDYTIVAFPYLKLARKPLPEVTNELGNALLEAIPDLASFNVVKGFINFEVKASYWTRFLNQLVDAPAYRSFPKKDETVLVEFSSPNTNKPLHLGHIRNILLGWSTSKLLDALGYQIKRVQIVNDRGIAICKSMLAWQKFGEEATPESKGMKSDHFVGHYYVLFEQKFKAEYAAWQQSEVGQSIFSEKAKKDQDEQAFFKAYKNQYFNQFSAIGGEARAMLLKWEANDEEVRALWNKMNGWVYAGFDETYDKLGVSFDKLYFESDTYLLGKELIEQGLEGGQFFKKEDGSVWADLEDVKLGEKILLRSDGTSVYMTQDIGTADVRYKDFGANRMVYVVADEQDYHFKVLFELMKRLEAPYAEGMHHLSYGMVNLPEGKMKSREGTVVDADDLVAEVTQEARLNVMERGELEGLDSAQQEEIIRKIGLAALKYFIIRVNPKKSMVFDPKESVDLQGQTGPYIQYSYVRIQGLMRKSNEAVNWSTDTTSVELHAEELELLRQLHEFPELLQQAANDFDPSLIAAFCYNLAKSYHKFYHEHQVLNAEEEATKVFRLKLSRAVGEALEFGMDLLGIEMPERM